MSDGVALFVRHGLLPAIWWAWGPYWWICSRDEKATTRRESAPSRLMHLGPKVVAAVVPWTPALGVPTPDARFLPRTPSTFCNGAALTVAGLAFSVWARRVLPFVFRAAARRQRPEH